MSLQIEQIVLYSPTGDVRSLRLVPNAVNVITGKSRTGKTSIIDIVDYCTGRGSCNVAAGVLRKFVSWYGLVLSISGSFVFIARRVPPDGAGTSSDIYYKVGPVDDLPSLEELTPTISPDALVEELTRYIGIGPNQNVPPAGQTRAPLRATFEHAKLLTCQSQSEITSRTTLFHRQGEPFLPQTIRDTLPYFLGAVHERTLSLREQLRASRDALSKLEERLANHKDAVAAGNDRARSLVSEAIDAGLLDTNPPSGQEISSLRSAMSQEVPPSVAVAGEEAERLRNEQSRLRREYAEKKAELTALQEYQAAGTGFSREAAVQQGRLMALDLLKRPSDPEQECPLCRSALQVPVPSVEALSVALQRVRSELEGTMANRPAVSAAIDRCASEIVGVRSRLSEIREVLGTLSAQTTDVFLASDLERRQAHVRGRISLYLETAALPELNPDIYDQIESLRKEVARLEEVLSAESVREATNAALGRIGRWMTDWAESLQMEYAGEGHRLDIVKLTVVADTIPKPIRMEQMGSAENWLGCHLISHFALHRYFGENTRPVPGYLILDQPTGAFYPPDTRDDASDGSDATDEDRSSVDRMYAWIFSVHKLHLPDRQIIILDHADLKSEEFQAAVRERWRGGKALVPLEWLDLPVQEEDGSKA